MNIPLMNTGDSDIEIVRSGHRVIGKPAGKLPELPDCRTWETKDSPQMNADERRIEE
jgi:hypothetical protein